MCLSFKQPTRQDKLRGFLAWHGVSQRALAKKLGVSEVYIGQILSGKRRPQYYIEKLIQMGIPSELLPEKIEK